MPWHVLFESFLQNSYHVFFVFWLYKYQRHNTKYYQTSVPGINLTLNGKLYEDIIYDITRTWKNAHKSLVPLVVVSDSLPTLLKKSCLFVKGHQTSCPCLPDPNNKRLWNLAREREHQLLWTNAPHVDAQTERLLRIIKNVKNFFLLDALHCIVFENNLC